MPGPSVSGQNSRQASGRKLPVVTGRPTVRASWASRRRAICLIAVHIIIAIHIAHWKWSGSTLTPVEPSEAMEFSKSGVINAGAIFFALAILSTLLLGRWFCGWGCHLVALQDLCRWLLGKIGVRPRPLRSSLLMSVPLLAFIYMFIGPLLGPLSNRLAGGAPVPRHQVYETHLFTSDFWATFPPWVPAVLTFAVCGFLIVYWLGSKGFCSYGCPYGGIFGVVDRFAPMRIRVTEDCTGSGHCTAVCSSNVRVHEEVRDFRMVVDPGCMKCLDCVAVCPNDALFVGMGVPAALSRGSANSVVTTRPASGAGASGILRWLLLAAFTYAAFTVFHGFDRLYYLGRFDFVLAGVMTGLALLVIGLVTALGGWNARPREYRLWEESLLGIAFLAASFAFRGLNGFVAFLFSLGISATLAFLVLQAAHFLIRPNLALHGWRLKQSGKWKAAGIGFVLILALAGTGWAAAGSYQYRLVHEQQEIGAMAERLAELRTALSSSTSPPSRELIEQASSLAGEIAARKPRELAHLRSAGLMLMDTGRLDQAAALYERGFERFGRDGMFLLDAGVCAARGGNLETATRLWTLAAEKLPRSATPRRYLGDAELQAGRWDRAAAHYSDALQRADRDIELWLSLAHVQAQAGKRAEALAALERASDIDASNEMIAAIRQSIGPERRP